MLVPLPNITYNVQEAVEYYNDIKQNHVDLMWTKKEMMDYLNPDQMTIIKDKEKNLDEMYAQFLKAVNYQEPFISWTPEKCLEFSREHFDKFTSGLRIWNIKNEGTGVLHPKLERQSELQFGFANKIMEAFPDAGVLELLYSPVGSKFNKHTDEGENLRIVMPVIADTGAVWHFDDKTNVTQLPGHAYMVLKHFPHATDVLGPSDRVNIHFVLPIKKETDLLNLKIHIGS
jgi:hypothetical protein